MIRTAYDTRIITKPSAKLGAPRVPHNKTPREVVERRRELALEASRKTPSQRALARALGVSQPDVCKYLKGQRPVPQRCLAALRKLAGVTA